jgi:CDK-activating kinase assembly factor MAT1
MINNVNIQETEERIERYRLENKDIIAQNTSKQQQEEKLLAAQLARERKEKMLRKEAYEKKALEQESLKKKEQLDIINRLVIASSGLISRLPVKQKSKISSRLLGPNKEKRLQVLKE